MIILFFHRSDLSDIVIYFLYADDYSIFDTPNDETARAASLLVPLRTGFTFGVRACSDARLLFSNLHVRTLLDYQEVLKMAFRDSVHVFTSNTV